MDTSHPQASALAIAGQRIVAVGDESVVRPFVGANTRVIDLEGHSLVPGLSDAHCHLYGLGKSLESVNLRGAKSAQEAAERAAAAGSKLPKGEWITGRGWDQNLWESKEFPNKKTLDALVPNRPVALRRIDGHALWANRAALQLAGVNQNTSDPPGGTIERDERGEATGVFLDNAMDLVEDKIPSHASAAAIERRILAAAKLASSSGLTSVHEMGISDEVIAAYRRLAKQGRLPVRVYAFLAGDAEQLRTLRERVPEIDSEGTRLFVLRAIKLYADGALGSRGAALLAPYKDDPDSSGLWVSEPAFLEHAASVAAAAGWQLGVHAIGDAGNRAVLDAYAKAHEKHPNADLRFRVEHAQVLSPGDIPRFAKLGVIASMQPTHATSDMPWAEKRIGSQRILGAYAWRSLLDTGAHVAFGSDFPVEQVAPLLGIYAAVTRQDAKGTPKKGWYPKQRLTLREALAAFTVEAAYASFVEHSRGIIRPGFVADLTVFDRKLRPDQSLLHTRVDMTVLGGAVAYKRE